MEIPPPFALRLYLNTREVLTLLPFSRRTLQRMVSQGRFPAAVELTTGIRAWRIDEILRWLNERNGKPS